ncbi:MAG: hypothetical protein A2233_02770 [Candidatus Kerfeldbacteria bacterium RIFOXYA2_FULL_38_24]|uniref:Flavoprotein n=1 Tax=Candidatus Kerfeldbacteria bacterium RIFOXYB2_FULL_38_14 TaxID=1798547 RepID=A0A1G2BDK0_9BACT|nr:MAG: hypothetical protein A2233_02770 [Candidatus Kerfeldbacteria bacterium RIFOXYA2_FULL_38_24]OGY87105.1 MAG: hypothetical protein A2319_02780 [Candidatus Kerfeldbacteria bacterium RIFOXYB2_FULL_38_14]
MSTKIAIIGGGAAGMMATARIKELLPQAQVVLFEKNENLGRKVMLTGGGRCNVTTGLSDVRVILKRYVRGGKFLTSAMWNFPPTAVCEWFAEHGVLLKTEHDQRVFPKSNNGAEIVGVFEKLFVQTEVDVRCNTSVKSIAKENADTNGFVIETGGKKENFSAVILTTGGQAYRHTGSTGDGYAFAEALGHKITPLAASLNSFVLAEKWIHELPGVSFKDIKITVVKNKKNTARGPLVCTHTGISGPAVFALSAQVAFAEYSKEHPLAVYLDWLPDESAQAIREKINTACCQYPKKPLGRLLQAWLPKSLVEKLLKANDIKEQIFLAEVNKQIRSNIIQQLKCSLVHLIGRGAGSEFVTAGGVDTNEIDPRTMQSRLVPGLFLAGEILNVDGVTGGFNLQSAWTTGYLAGESVCESVIDQYQ